MIRKVAEIFVEFFFFNDTATTEIYTLSLHDALPIWAWTWPTSASAGSKPRASRVRTRSGSRRTTSERKHMSTSTIEQRSEEHTSELQSRQYLVCRLLLEKKNTKSQLYSTMPKIKLLI